MGATPKRIRESLTVKRSSRDKGWVLTVKIVAYDSGMIQVDGIPINDKASGYDPADGWLGAADVLTSTLSEFRRHVTKAKPAT
jgi:hypothetical protein